MAAGTVQVLEAMKHPYAKGHYLAGVWLVGRHALGMRMRR